MFEFKETPGLFNKITPEEVLATPGRPIRFGRTGLEQGQGGAHPPEKTTTQWRAIAGGEEARRRN
jgi:hypothetical protein